MVYFMREATEEELSVLSVLGVFFTLLSLSDVGVGPTLTRKIAELSAKKVCVEGFKSKIKAFYLYLSLILAGICTVAYFFLDWMFSWDGKYIYVYLVWALAGLINAKYSYVTINLVGFGYIQKHQIGLIINKLFFVLMLYMTASYVGILMAWSLSALIGVILQVIVNIRFQNQIPTVSNIQAEVTTEIKKIILDSYPLGIYYLSSLIISKCFIYYFNRDVTVPGVGVANVVERFMGYLFLVSNVPTTFLITRFVEANTKKMLDEKKRILVLSLGIFSIVGGVFLPCFIYFFEYIELLGISLNSFNIQDFVLLTVFFMLYDELNKHVNTYLYAAGENGFIVRSIIAVSLLVTNYAACVALDVSNFQFIVNALILYFAVYNVSFLRVFK